VSKQYPNSVSAIPSTEHWAIVEDVSVYTPGDERSRTHPGHGYPASTEHYFNYIVFMDKKEWEADIRQRMADNSYGRKSFKAMRVTPAKIAIQATIDID
jgi:hypothetical protein